MTIKVLTIDDDPAMTELLTLLLESHGLQVVSTNDSQQSVKLLLVESPDIVLLDLMMPEKNGWDICREIRKQSRVPIVILSALDDPALIANALDAGADDYMTKPVPSSVLIAHINNLTRRAEAENAPEKPLLRQTGSLNQAY